MPFYYNGLAPLRQLLIWGRLGKGGFFQAETAPFSALGGCFPVATGYAVGGDRAKNVLPHP